MGKKLWFIIVYGCVLCGMVVAALGVNEAVTTLAEAEPPTRKICYVIDAGHGGEDGGATSCTGVLESKINLEISLRLNDLMHLLGMDTEMIRTTDISVYTEGNSIATKKVSDLKERVRLVNGIENAVLVSIHQNYFNDGRYSGAQVFYSTDPESKLLAQQLQNGFKSTVNPNSNRDIKQASGIYLMQHVSCPAVLIECGFLSNYEEEAKLRDPGYQKSICCVIAATLSKYANT